MKQPSKENSLIKRLSTSIKNWLTNYLTRPIKPPRLHFFNFERMCDEVRPGDVVLIEGRNRNSEIIKYVTFSTWTHAALYIGPIHSIKDDALRKQLNTLYPESNDAPLILESILGQGTLLKPLSKYRQEHMRICRPIGLAHDDAEKIMSYACEQLGKSYNVRHFLDLGRFLLKSKFLPRLWRSSLFSVDAKNHSSQEICSTMLARAFGSIDFPIMPLINKSEDDKDISLIPRNPRLFTPADFDYSPYFNIIKYPIFALSKATNTSELPWDETQQHNDELGMSKQNKHDQKQSNNK